MQTFTSLPEFLAHRVGSRLRATHFSYGFPREGLALAVAVGRFDFDDLHAMIPLLEAALRFPPHDALWDMSRVDQIVPSAFAQLERFLRAYFRSAITARRVAVVAPTQGLLRAVGAGLFAFLEAPYAVSTFEDARAALAWLGAVEADARLLEQETDSLVAHGFGSVVAAWLDAHLDATIDACARGVGVSVRTLQRRLTASGTSFVAESSAARIRAAEHRLATDASLTSIAYEVGFSSPQRFASVFRRIKGESPSAARARLRVASNRK